MSALCQDVVSFADGELEPERAEAFRSHLATCAACRAALLEAMQLGARLGALSPPTQHLKLAPEPAARTASEPVSPAPGSGRRPRPKWRLLSPWSGAGLGAVALAAVALVAVFPRSREQPASPFAAVTTRPYDIRLAYSDVVPHRPKRDELRGAGGAGKPEISLAAQLMLQDRGDQHGLAITRVYNGESPAMLAEQLGELPSTPAIRSDRAALEILSKSPDNADSVLAELDALRASDDPVVARAARWNYAVLLSRLELPLDAAKAFREIAAEHEAGWAEEASDRAATDDKRAADAHERWNRAVKAGEALVATGAAVPPDLVSVSPGLIRAYLYDAVRAAPSRERVRALAPLAADLDRVAGQRVLSDYVRRVAGLDFRRRASLARSYALLRGGSPAPEILGALADPRPSVDVADIVMGAIAWLEVVPDHVDAYRAMVKQAGDPWFEILLAKGEAAAAVRHGDWLAAEARLRKAQALCSSEGDYRCGSLALQLTRLYQDLHRVPEAIAVAQSGLRVARSSGAWGQSLGLLLRLADVHRFNASIAMARAYANEVLLMAPDYADYVRVARLVLVGSATRDLDGRAARRALELVVRDAGAGLSTEDAISAANHLADIGRLDPQPGDLAQLQGWLGKLRAGGALTPTQQVLADELEGRLVIESDRSSGAALIERAIAGAAKLPREVVAQKARTAAYSVLVFDAARHADPARVITLTAQELGRPPPGPCSVAMVAEDERGVVVVRGADGRDHAVYDGARRAGSEPLAVPADLARQLDGCDHVQVMAPAAVQGRPRILPANLPWSYATGAHGATSPAGHEPTTVQTLIVTDVMPPPELRLPLLSPRAIDPAASTHTLSGPSATPTQVLAAMRDASEIQFHTHALVDLGVSDASYLVLSPGPDGRYALTAEAIRGAELRGRPIIVLAACHAAQGARYQHAPWSLPDAFLAVGARAVFAAATTIPDLEAGPFFNRVLERVRAGAAPAAALRDERVASLASNPSSWVADVMLFE